MQVAMYLFLISEAFWWFGFFSVLTCEKRDKTKVR